MRDGWQQVTLGHIATRRKDFTPVDGATLYRVVGVQRSGWGLVDREPVRGDSMKFDKLIELHTGDLVYRTITAFEAPSAVVGPDYHGAFATPQTFPTYRLQKERVSPQFVALLTTWPSFHEEMSSRCVGSVLRRKTLSQGAFEAIPIDLPPIDEQRRIVDLIAAIDTAIDAADAEARATEDALTSTLAAAVAITDRGSHCLADMFNFMLGGAWGSEPGVDEQSVTALGPTAYRGGVTSVDPSPGSARSLSLRRAEARTLLPGDIVLERSGGSPTQPVGRVIRMDDSHPWVVPSDFMRLLRVDISSTHPGFAFWVLWMSYRTGGALPFQKRTTSIFNLNITDYLAGVRFHLPAAKAQAEIATLGDSGWAAVESARATAGSLRVLRSNLLTVLLSGDHEIPQSYDRLLEEVA